LLCAFANSTGETTTNTNPNSCSVNTKIKTMKLFLTVFAAIIMAAIVIFTGLFAKGRIDQWEMAKRLYTAQAGAELAGAERIATQNTRRLQALAGSARTEEDLLNVANAGSDGIAALEEAGNRMKEAHRGLLCLLENKPFGIPLTAEEREDLNAIRTELATK
jgi:hypothetical protein